MSALKSTFDTEVGAVVDPLIISATVGDPLAGDLATSPDGVTVSVMRARYSLDPTAPVFVEYSPNSGVAACGGSGRQMQGGASRPSVLTGLADCSDLGVVYNEFGGSGEASTRDAVELSFSRPVIAFGAWFGDLETRTDGQGVPAVVYLFGPEGDLVEQFQVTPDGDQSLCENSARLCGNETTRWVGFTDVLVGRMVVVVGDEDATGTANDEGISLVGPTPVSPTVSMSATVDTTGVEVAVGATVIVPVTITNTGQVPVTLTDFGVVCADGVLGVAAATTCDLVHTVTAADVLAGGFTVGVDAAGTWYDLPAAASATGFVPLRALVTPLAPGLDPAAGCGVEPEVVVPSVEGVVYSQTRSGEVVSVTAAAAAGYVLPDGEWEWEFTVTADPCIVPAVGTDPLPQTGVVGAEPTFVGALGAIAVGALFVVAGSTRRASVRSWARSL
ncbi:MAG: hypothetical protein KF727_14500 [Microbacteriaceae bacterium]|nr:hypothetical protein [Microbacteriaceae bacterium]